jgi:DNA polymerase-3 subunit alpha
MVQTKKTLADIDKAMSENDMQDFFELQDANLWMKSEEELNEKWEKDYRDTIPYEVFCEAKRETVRVCQRAKGVKIDRTIKFPEFPDADDQLWDKIKIGLKFRGFTGNVPKNYSDRIREEYSLVCRKGFSTYFLIQQKMTNEARRACPEILGWGDGSEALGCGRGSAPGSLICFLLGITDVDPIEEDLLFSRFLSESRGGRMMKLEFDEEDFVK